MTTDAVAAARPPRFAELVAFTAAVMALNALAIDMMLPALGAIGAELGARRPNDRQLVIVAYVVGNGIAQLAFGPIVDRFGRRPVLIGALAAYVLGSALCIAAQSFPLLLAARIFQGVSTAATRVASVAIVRDLYAGRRMAEVMSLAITVFMAAPILAPSLGQLILLAAPWRGVFVALLLYGLVIALWAALRIGETLPASSRAPLNLRRIGGAYWTFLSHRVSHGYTLASALTFGALFGYISASEQIFVETFHLGARFPLAFAAVAAALAASTLLNARIVGRIGMRPLSHGAVLAFTLANLCHFALARAGVENFALFMAFMMFSFFCLGLVGANMAAIALEPMGAIAGAAAAANGFAGTTLAGVVGGLIGRQYDGTATPIVGGFALVGALAFGLIAWIERGRLFRQAAR
jgi:DHA1 family bicyclomycin/chloramphenicol resistance-like MFS transporter